MRLKHARHLGEWMTLYKVFAAGRMAPAFVLAACLVFAASTASVLGDTHLPPHSIPTGRVVLTVQGNIQLTNAYRQADFDIAMLMSIPSTQIVTTTPWTEGSVLFEGVSMNTLLSHVASKGLEVEVTALNDYTVRIPIEDFTKFNPIIAYKMNGKLMAVRDKGPLWLIYPLDDHEQLQSAKYRDRMVWQLRTITVN